MTIRSKPRPTGRAEEFDIDEILDELENAVEIFLDLSDEEIYFDEDGNGPFYHEDWVMQGTKSEDDEWSEQWYND